MTEAPKTPTNLGIGGAGERSAGVVRDIPYRIAVETVRVLSELLRDEMAAAMHQHRHDSVRQRVLLHVLGPQSVVGVRCGDDRANPAVQLQLDQEKLRVVRAFLQPSVDKCQGFHDGLPKGG